MVALAERLRLELDSSDRKNLVGIQIIPDKWCLPDKCQLGARNGFLGNDGGGRGRLRLVGHPEIIAASALSECGKVGQFFAEHLLNFRLQMGCFGANEECLTQTKPTKIDQNQQVRVN